MRSYMEMNREMFEKLSTSNQKEEDNKNRTQTQLAHKWEMLEKKVQKRV